MKKPTTAEVNGAGEENRTLPSYPLFPDRLKFAMERANVGPAQLAREINCGTNVISNLRNRSTASYRGPFLMPIAKALGVPTDWLAWNVVGAATLTADCEDVIAELAAVVGRLVGKGVMTRAEVVATINLLRVREEGAG